MSTNTVDLGKLVPGTVVVYKFKLEAGENHFMLPPQSIFLDVAFQDNELCVWAVIPFSGQLMPLRLLVAATGSTFPNQAGLRYIGTARQIQKYVSHGTHHVQHSHFVLHVFELP